MAAEVTVKILDGQYSNDSSSEQSGNEEKRQIKRLKTHVETVDHNQNGLAAPGKTGKRTDYINWDDYFMAVAFLSAQRSKDPNSQVGACIANEDRKIVGIGYNGMPIGCSDDELPWSREANSELDTKYPYVCHAEVNAIMNKNSASTKDCSIYVGLFPCNECAKIMIQAGIKEVVYKCDKYHDKPAFIASRKLLDMAGVNYRQYVPTRKHIVIDFSSLG